MTEMLRADHVAVAGRFEELSFTAAGGELVTLVTSKEEENATITRLLLGLAAPDRGTLQLFGRDLATLPRRELLEMRQRIGVVFAGGGLVSNLKVWENLTLPLVYHSALASAEIEERGLGILKRVGYDGKLMQLPGHLTLYQKRQVGFGRAMLGDPDLMIFESPLQGLNRDEREALMETALAFHGEKSGRVSLFLTSNPGLAELLPGARVVNLYDKGRAEK